MTTPDEAISPADEPIHDFFELSYAAYLVLPRSLLQSLSVPTQRALVAAVDAVRAEIAQMIGSDALVSLPPEGQYVVYVRDQESGRFLRDPLLDYERGRRRITPAELRAYCTFVH
jgi:hypothetical protein